MLRTRVLTVLVLLALLTAAAAISTRAIAAMGTAFLGAALYEWLRLSAVSARAALCVAAAAACAALAAAWLGLEISPRALQAMALLACIAWLGIGIMLVAAQRGGVHLTRAFLVTSALLLAPMAWLCLIALLRLGPLWTVSVLVLVWLADIAAYFAGRAFGRSKLAPRISPGKTWAGVWGALIAVVGLSEAVRWIWPDAALWSTRILEAAPVTGILVLLVLVLMSIVGDLFESLVKRQAGAKDSGSMLPGHGGVWDRIDATLPVLPLAVLGHWVLLGGMPVG
jgi:phosphatidate cytidylyltransferase